MNIATIPPIAKLSHIRTMLQQGRKAAKRDVMLNFTKALEYLDDIEMELRK